MFDALREIMAADFQKAEEKGIAQGMEKASALASFGKQKKRQESCSK